MSHYIEMKGCLELYEEYLSVEKANSDKFLNSVRISRDRFYLNEYEWLRPLFEDDYFVKDVLEVIDDILFSYKLPQGGRLVILGDFLFSMTSCDLHDPANFIFKTTRNDYMDRIVLRSIVNVCLEYDPFIYVEIHKKLLIGLRVACILTKSIIRTNKGKKWESSVYFLIELSGIESKYSSFLGICHSQFKVIHLNSSQYSIGSFRSIWKIRRKKREMESFKLSYESVAKSNSICFTLSHSIFKLNNYAIEKEKMRLLSKYNCKTIEEYVAKVIRILKDNSYASQLFYGGEKVQNVEYRDVVDLKNEIKNESIHLLKYFQKIIPMLILKRDIFDKDIYLPCFIDNRGRQYYGTLLSPTFNKIFRYLYEFKKKRTFENLEDSVYYKKIMKYSSTVEEFSLFGRNIYISIVLFIEIGKFFIKKGGDYMIKTEKIIDLGILNYKNKNKDLEFEDLLYIQKIYDILDDVLSKKCANINTLIFKDATASGLQNYGIVAGYNIEKIEYLNINGDDWCDTYQYMVNKFVEDGELRKRKYWKSTIMTIPYNAVWYTCFVTFISALRNDGIEYKDMSEEKQEHLKKIHKKFYESVKNTVKDEFYMGENNIKMFKYQEWKIVGIEEYKITYKNHRDKYRNILYMLSDDNKATIRGLEANNMHYLDSLLVQRILSKFDVMSIHDCFGIRLCELHNVMDEINLYYTEKVGVYTYSIHIIL